MQSAYLNRIPEDLQSKVSLLNELIKSSPGGNSLPTNSIDEIVPGLYLGDRLVIIVYIIWYWICQELSFNLLQLHASLSYLKLPNWYLVYFQIN